MTIDLLKADQKIDLNSEDFFNYLPKVNFIQNFLENDNNKTFLTKNNLISLYGRWGSGKSSILNTLQLNIEKENNDFKTLFFEAWKYENDNNLAYSLFEFIAINFCSGSFEKVKELLKKTRYFFRGFAKSISFNTTQLYNNYPVGFTWNPSDIFEEYERLIEENSNNSFYANQEFFKEQFDKILPKKNNRLIVFIDDLDRCETENILKLLSAIKLFFTLSSKVIFICGIDKTAVTNALQYKYNDIHKAEEYLEKIFPISFSVPKNITIENLIASYFKPSIDLEQISNFFETIKFKNPRHLKKILNKYKIIEKMYLNKPSSKYNDFIPNINSDSDNTFNIIFVLYFIILYEFKPDFFYELKNYNKKISNYQKNFYSMEIYNNNSNGKNKRIAPFIKYNDYPKFYYHHDEYKEIKLADFTNIYLDNITYDKRGSNNMLTYENKKNIAKSIKLISLLSPNLESPMVMDSYFHGWDNILIGTDKFLEFFNINHFSMDFIKFIIKTQKEDLLILDNNYKFKNLFKLAEIIL